MDDITKIKIAAVSVCIIMIVVTLYTCVRTLRGYCIKSVGVVDSGACQSV